MKAKTSFVANFIAKFGANRKIKQTLRDEIDGSGGLSRKSTTTRVSIFKAGATITIVIRSRLQ